MSRITERQRPSSRQALDNNPQITPPKPPKAESESPKNVGNKALGDRVEGKPIGRKKQAANLLRMREPQLKITLPSEKMAQDALKMPADTLDNRLAELDAGLKRTQGAKKQQLTLEKLFEKALDKTLYKLTEPIEKVVTKAVDFLMEKMKMPDKWRDKMADALKHALAKGILKFGAKMATEQFDHLMKRDGYSKDEIKAAHKAFEALLKTPFPLN